MEIICIGPKTYVRHQNIAQIIELKDLLDKTALIKAQKQCRVISLIGRAHRTAVYLTDGKIVLTPLAADTIHARIQAATW